jgi:hypothetical protein
MLHDGFDREVTHRSEIRSQRLEDLAEQYRLQRRLRRPPGLG